MREKKKDRKNTKKKKMSVCHSVIHKVFQFSASEIRFAVFLFFFIYCDLSKDV